MRTERVIDALGIGTTDEDRCRLSGLRDPAHGPDHLGGVRTRLGRRGIVPSMGSVGDCYDNSAMNLLGIRCNRAPAPDRGTGHRPDDLERKTPGHVGQLGAVRTRQWLLGTANAGHRGHDHMTAHCRFIYRVIEARMAPVTAMVAVRRALLWAMRAIGGSSG